MMTSGMKKSEITTSEISLEETSEAISEMTSEAISEVTSEAISKSNEFNRRVSLLIDCGAMKDKDWQNQDVKKKMKAFLKLWEKMQKGMTYTTSPISYVQLKEDRKRTREKVLKAAK